MTARSPKYLVLIGGGFSAIDALVQFFSPLHTAEDVSFVVSLHGSDQMSQTKLPLRLARATHLPVEVLNSGAPIESGRVYIAPCAEHLWISDGVIGSDRFGVRGRESEHDIDCLFESIAREWGNRVFAILLSGHGLDGIRALQNVREAGGTIMVQSPMSAMNSSLLKATLERVSVDFVLEPKDLMVQCLSLMSGCWPRIEVLEPATRANDSASPERRTIYQLFDVLKQRTNVDLSGYSHPSIARQIEKRMRIGNCARLEDYLERLTLDFDECEALSRDCLISVTRFFRDPDAFEIISRKCVRPLVAQARAGEPIRIWVPACASGEEAYSLAILFLEAELSHGRRVEFKIFATDLDAQSVQAGSLGVFTSAQMESLPGRFQARYFSKRQNHFVAAPFLRERIVFAQHDLLKSPPFRNMHLISCRNFLHYLVTDLRTQVLDTLQKSLHEGGFLFLGASETVDGFDPQFEALARNARIYKRTNLEYQRDIWPIDTRKVVTMPESVARVIGVDIPEASAPSCVPAVKDPVRSGASNLRTNLGVTASVTFLEDGQVTDFQGDLKPYLICSDAPLSLHIEDVLRKPYQRAFHSLWVCLRLLRESRPVILPSPSFAGEEIVYLEGRMHRSSDLSGVLYQVRFLREVDLPAGMNAYFCNQILEGATQKSLAEVSSDNSIQMRASLTALEGVNFEIQNSNEELLSINEELSSINEELLTANAELQRLNSRHSLEIEELRDSQGEWGALLGAVGVSVLGLDSELRIQSFTTDCERYIHILDNDIGRPLEHLAFRIQCGCESGRLREILRDGKMTQWRMPMGRDGQVLVRIVPESVFGRDLYKGLKIFFIDLSTMSTTQLIRAKNSLESLQARVGNPQANAPIGNLHRAFSTHNRDLII